MDIGTIVPAAYVEKFCHKSNFHLVLAHIVESNRTYCGSYVEFARRGDMIILDNSSFEIGDGVYTPQDLVKIADRVGATVVMAPETYGDAQDTINKVANFCTQAKKVRKGIKIFGTVHGKDFDDIRRCHKTLVNLGVDVIGFSCRLDPEHMDCKIGTNNDSLRRSLARANLIHLLRHDLSDKVHYHLLGLNHPMELAMYTDLPQIKSNDTSCAYIHGLEGVDIQKTLGYFSKSNTRVDFFMEDALKSTTTKLINKNMQTLHSLANGC